MHQIIKKVFRFSLMICIFLITTALVVTCMVKTKEIWQADQHYLNRQTIHFHSDAQHQYLLISNNQKPDRAALIVLKDQGYLAKLNCEPYLKDVCTDAYNLFQTRYVQQASIQTIGNQSYFQNIQWVDIQSNKTTSLTWSPQDIQQFYHNDITHLKYILGALILFTIMGLYCCYRLIRNVGQFLEG